MEAIKKALYILFLLAIAVTVFTIYLWIGSSLISGIFNIEFTKWQFMQGNILVWILWEIKEYFKKH